MKKHIYLAVILTVIFSSCSTEEPIPTYTLAVSVSPAEAGKITISPQSPDYKEGEMVTLTAEPNEHWVFKQWEGDGSGSTTPLQLTMDSNKSIVGVFVKKEYPLKITISGEGTVEEKIIPNPGGREYPHGTTVELTPKPKEGWVFESWGGDLTGTESPKTIKVDKEKNVTVKFIRNQTVTALNCSAATNNGTLTSGVAVTGVVNIIIPYSGAFGGTHNGQTVSSTGITGLTATLAAGTFANGAGNLTYIITGTPSAVGTASFAINIGEQNCTVNFTVSLGGPLITTIVDVINPKTGKIWMDRNLGATQAATSRVDAASYGDLYQWGRRADGHQLRNSATTTTLSSIDQPAHGSFIPAANGGNLDWRSPQNDNLWQGVNGVNNPCPTGYRIPIEAELIEEMESWITKDAQGAFSFPLKWPSAGYRVSNSGSLSNPGILGSYWSSTVRNLWQGVNGGARLLSFVGFDNTNGASMETNSRASGFSVRCIKD